MEQMKEKTNNNNCRFVQANYTTNIRYFFLSFHLVIFNDVLLQYSMNWKSNTVVLSPFFQSFQDDVGVGRPNNLITNQTNCCCGVGF